MRRAFDSIPRNLQRLAWRRLGVPADLAEWFVSLDEDGTAFVEIPYYTVNKRLKTSNDILHCSTHFPKPSENTSDVPTAEGFQPQRGIGQGESASSLMWVAVYDILLDWIDPTNTDLHPVGYHDLLRPTNHLAPLSPATTPLKEASLANAYADDLATISTGANAYTIQQLQAEWFSAFCAFTGLQLNMTKIVPVSIGAHEPRIPTFLTVYDHKWQPTKCPITHDPQNLVYLGLKLDHIITNKPMAAIRDIKVRMTTMLEHLLDQPGTVPSKIDYIRFKILPIILHTAQCANWSLPQYRELDKPFTKAYKTLLVLPIHFPTALLYLPLDKGGVGLPRLSDRTQVMKWRAFQRSIAVGQQAASAINSILSRLPQDTAEAHPLQIIPSCRHWKPQMKLLARSLIDWLHESGITLARTLTLTADQEEIRARNVVSLADVAKKMHLWYDPDIHDPDLSLLPLHCYVTDGSFKTQVTNYYDILTDEDDLNAKGIGAAAIVFLPSALDRSPLPHTVRITTRTPQPGMSAYAWELLAQLVALKLTQHYPHTLQGYSDCTATIDRINTALSSSIDQLGHTTAGILSSSAHAHSSPRFPRRIQHIAAHPEKDTDRWNNPTPLDKAIFLADAIAGQSTTKYNKQYINHVSHALILEDILPELLPHQAWHMRHTHHLHIPVLDSPWRYQHKYQLTNYLQNRDHFATIDNRRWQSTAVDFAAHIHPIPHIYKGSFWKAARRTSILFDWMGHGHNIQKRLRNKDPFQPSQPTPPSPCKHCGQHDDQSHIMLQCTNPLLTPIRIAARVQQSHIANTLMREHKSNITRHFIQQVSMASWLSASPTTNRIWTGMWNKDTLTAMFPNSHDMTSSMPHADRHKYRKLVQLLTQPLIAAYKQMICIGTRKIPCKSDDAPPPTISQRTKHQTSLLFHQQAQAVNTNHLTHLHMSANNSSTAFSYSDAAFSLTDVDIGTIVHTST